MLKKLISCIVAGVFLLGIMAVPVGNAAAATPGNTLVSDSSYLKDAKKIKVKMTVVSDKNKKLYNKTLSVNAGYNAFDLLKKGVGSKNMTYTTSEWGKWVTSIYGIENDTYGTGADGWNYTINGKGATTMPEKCILKKGDKVVWYYDMDGM